MQFIAPESAAQVQLVAGWLSQQENFQWLDLGDGQQLVSPQWLMMAMRRGTYVLRLFTPDGDDRPIGVVALSNVSTQCKTANVWIVLGDRSYGGQGYATRATDWMLSLGFRELGLHAIHTWVVEHNPSLRVARRVGFKPIGRQRACHVINGRAYDRLWFDLLASEYEELQAERRRESA